MSEYYQGYRLVIDGTPLNDSLVAKGSYKFNRTKRTSGTWTDLNGVFHEDVLPITKTVITFQLRQRNLAEQESIKNLFASMQNVRVQYWDDLACRYRLGNFMMRVQDINHYTIEPGGIQYNATQVTLEEY